MKPFIRMITAALLVACACAAQAQEQFGEWDMTVPQFQQMVETVRERLLQPGDHVPGWDRGGANPEADLRAAGADRHYFRLRDAKGDSVMILTDRPLASFVPDSWRAVDTYGSAATEVDNPYVQFDAVSPRYVIGLRANSERRRDTDCVEGVANATLYERTDVPASAADDDAQLVFRLTFLAIEGMTVCTRYQGNSREGYSSLVFLPDGRSLPRINERVEHITIIPAGPIEQLVTYTDVDSTT